MNEAVVTDIDADVRKRRIPRVEEDEVAGAKIATSCPFSLYSARVGSVSFSGVGGALVHPANATSSRLLSAKRCAARSSGSMAT